MTPERAMEQSDGVCTFCKRKARRNNPVCDVSAYDVDCEACGKYRIIGTREEIMIAIPDPRHAPWLPIIVDANARGMRISIPDAAEIPLEPPNGVRLLRWPRTTRNE